MIKKILTIENMAVFQNFDWNKTVRDHGNNIVEFKKINILYGRNYSGKTTISRILRALETGTLSEKLDNPKFSIEIDGDGNVDQNELNQHSQTIRVFNEDFVKENLRFIIDEDHSIDSFAILGDDNNIIERTIEEKEALLGSEEKGDGVFGTFVSKQSAFTIAKTELGTAESSLNEKLKDKSNRQGTGIKHNKAFGDANYNITKIKQDITRVAKDDYSSIDADKVSELTILLKEEPKNPVVESPELRLQFSPLLETAKELLEKKIAISEPIQGLMSDTILQNWVRTGKDIHKGKKDICGFCGNIIPSDLWSTLDKHFNKESENLRIKIDDFCNKVATEEQRSNSLLTFNDQIFYAKYHGEINTLKSDFDSKSKEYKQALKLLNTTLKKRLDDIFTPIELPEINDVTVELKNIREQYEELRKETNDFTDTLSSKQSKAKNDLRLNEVHKFIEDIKYYDALKKIEDLGRSKETAQNELNVVRGEVNSIRQEISVLKAQLKDESKGAERVNDYLNNFFGHHFLSLIAVEGDLGYRFEVIRNGKKAYHLSEGECSLIAFCYFMAKLDDVETKNSSPIIWIDDPISSLDGNHIFFVFSLINADIVKKNRFQQLFISTHDLNFFKYIKRLSGAENKKNAEYFLVERNEKNSVIRCMPKYLKEYVTEFNYLFHQIYKCAKADVTDDSNHDCFYNFGNNARKFLETFLYFKYPNAKDKDDKLIRFFGNDDLAASLTDRVNNEYSHLCGVFERSTTPVDVPEMKKTADFLLNKIKDKDSDQYDALLESIGISIVEQSNA